MAAENREMIQPCVRLRRLGRDVDIISGFAFKSTRFGISGLPLVRIRDLASARDTATFYLGPYDQRYIVNSGDILVGMDGGFRIATWRGPTALLNQRVCKLVPKQESVLNQRFLFHALQRPLEEEQRKTSGTTVVHLSARRIRALLIPELAGRHQLVIAAVLDAIDEVIERTDAVISATERLRDALLHDLLTRGVRGLHSQWRESRSLGTIPADWQVVRLGDVAEVRNGATPSRARLDYWQDGDIPFVKTGQVNDVFIVEPDEFITSQAVTAGAVVVPKRSVLIAMIGQGRTRGMTARLGFDAAINQNFAAVYGADEDFSLGFFFAWATHNYSVIRALGQGSNQDALNCALIEGIRVPKPSAREQRTIATMVDSIDAAIRQTRDERQELQSLKASSADALLTGRVRVRGIGEIATMFNFEELNEETRAKMLQGFDAEDAGSRF